MRRRPLHKEDGDAAVAARTTVSSGCVAIVAHTGSTVAATRTYARGHVGSAAVGDRSHHVSDEGSCGLGRAATPSSCAGTTRGAAASTTTDEAAAASAPATCAVSADTSRCFSLIVLVRFARETIEPGPVPPGASVPSASHRFRRCLCSRRSRYH